MSMTIPQTLRAAADHLAQYGWARGTFYRPKVVQRMKPYFLADGQVPQAGELQYEDYLDYEHAPACSLGALAQVTGAREVLTATRGDDGLFMDSTTVDVLSKQNPAVKAYVDAGQALRDYLEIKVNDEGHGLSIPSWNDGVAKDVEAVIAMFREAADFIETYGEVSLAIEVRAARERNLLARERAAAERRQMLDAQQAELALIAADGDAEAAWQKIDAAKLVETKEAMVKLAVTATDVSAYLDKVTETLTAMAKQAGIDPAVLADPPVAGWDADPADVPAADTTEADAVDALQGAMAIVNAATSAVPA